MDLKRIVRIIRLVRMGVRIGIRLVRPAPRHRQSERSEGVSPATGGEYPRDGDPPPASAASSASGAAPAPCSSSAPSTPSIPSIPSTESIPSISEDSPPPEERSPQRDRPAGEAFRELERALLGSGRWRPGWDRAELCRVFQRLEELDRGSESRTDSIPSTQSTQSTPSTPSTSSTSSTLNRERSKSESAAPLSVWFSEFLLGLPPAAPMGEAAPRRVDATPRFASGGPVAAAPISAPSMDLHLRAAALAASRPGLTYTEALIEAARRG